LNQAPVQSTGACNVPDPFPFAMPYAVV
jgi:hypothetical protein